MTKEKNEEVLRRIKTIHPDLRRAVASSANADKIFEIGKNYNLLVDKMGELASETMYLMLGVTHPDEFVGNLAERLQVDRQTASKIADDINKEIFSPVREHLRGLFNPSASGQATPSPTQPHIHQREISEERLPETGRLTSKISGRAPESTLEDFESELKKVLAEEKGASPLHIVKQESAQHTKQDTKNTYKDLDPYREQVDEGLPNTRGAPYVPQNMNYGKEEQTTKIPPGLPFPPKAVLPLVEEKGVTENLDVKNGSLQPFRLAPPSRPVSQTKPAFEQSAKAQGIQKDQVSGIRYQGVEKQAAPQPTPTPTPIEDISLFSPTKSTLPGNTQGESAANGTLKAFRGFNMNTIPKEKNE